MECRSRKRLRILLFVLAILGGAVVGIARPGDLDPTFSGDGKLTDWSGWATDVVIQPDGKIVVAGLNPPFSWSGPPPNHDFLVARYHTDGSPDMTFGAGTGKVVIDSGLRDYVSGVAIQGDGKIVLAGRFEGVGGSGVVVRLNPSGSFDTSFGSNGIAITSCSPSSVDVQPDGRIVISHLYVGVCRHNSEGTPDTSFGVGGFVSTDISDSFEYQWSSSLLIQPDGKIVVGGGVEQDHSNQDVYSVLVRYNQDGSLDTSFGGTGIVTTRPTEYFGTARTVLLRPDGKIVALGDHIARYNSDGTLDSGFGSGGIVSSSVPLSDAALQTDGKIVASGTTGTNSDTNRDFVIARYRTNGSLDTSFGGGDGISTVDFNNANDFAHAMALDSQGSAVVAGLSYPGQHFALARLLLDTPSAPFDYDGDGKTDLSVWRPSNRAWYVAGSRSGDVYVQQITLSCGSCGDLGGGWGPVPADYDGDAQSDVSELWCCDDFDPNNLGSWIIFSSSTNSISYHGNYFAFDELAVPADYDGDGKADRAFWHSSNGNWSIALSQSGSTYTQQWGIPGDKPVPADFDGDGNAELAVFRPSEGKWYVLSIATGSVSVVGWGLDGDIPVPGDYNGDGRADFAVYRPSDNTWYRAYSSDGSIHINSWGLPGDLLVPGDYDGDGSNDLAVFRPSDSTWYIVKSSGGIYIERFGLPGDIPTPNVYIY